MVMSKRHAPSHRNPVACSKYLSGAAAINPLRLTPDAIDAAVYRVERDGKSAFQALHVYQAAQRWKRAVRHGEYVYLSGAGAYAPAGLGGLIADGIARGLIDVVVTTGAQVYHDLHFACGLPVRRGKANVDDDSLRKDETTRIYNAFIHNKWTLKAQDMINQDFAKTFMGEIKLPYSTATLVNRLGKVMLEDRSGKVIDKKGSFVVRAAEYGVPIFLDSGSNHSLGMDMTILFLDRQNADTSPSMDVLEMAALNTHTQPQLNIFLGEGGPRNFTQTTAPTASEIYYMSEFEGSEGGCIRFTTADERTGGLSGSGKSEAESWGKYTHDAEEIVVWGEYTLYFPDVIGFVAGKASREPRRLMAQLPVFTEKFLEEVKRCEPRRRREQAKLRKLLPYVAAAEKRLRKREGYGFE
jgi:deoxyhypusine synthase